MAYLCYICLEEFTHVKNLHEHLASTHTFNTAKTQLLKTDSTNVQCDICGKMFKKLWLLRKHMIESHRVKYGPDLVTCFLCHKQFTRNKILYKHLRFSHGFIGENKPLPHRDCREQCEMCSRQLSSKATKSKHMATVHGMPVGDGLKCPLKNCSDFRGRFKALLKHIKEVHNIEIEKEETTFTSWEKFEEWKQLYEKKSLSSYALLPTRKSPANGRKRRHYKCRQSFRYRPSRPCKDPSRTYKTCTSRIEAISTESGVCVQFWKSHIGHSIGTGKESNSELNDHPCDVWIEHIGSASVFNLSSDNADSSHDDDKEQCEICSKLTKCNRRHMATVHGINLRSGLNQSRMKCPIDNCTECFGSFKSLLKHVKGFHHIEIEVEEIIFITWEDFKKWKETYELSTSSSYVAQRPLYKSVKGVEMQYYKCRHSLQYRPSRPCKDPNRTYKTCTSRMAVTLIENFVRVTFWKTHIGHSTEPKQAPLSESSKSVKVKNTKLLTTKYTNLNHMTSVHGKTNFERKMKFRIKCPVENCQEQMVHYKSLLEHVKEIHNVNVEKEENTFATWEDFQKWKNQYENDTLSRYVVLRSERKAVNGIKRISYKCQHTFFYRPSKPCKDPNRVYKSCTSRMEVVLSENGVRVKLWKTHIGHMKGILPSLRRKTYKQPCSKASNDINSKHHTDAQTINHNNEKNVQDTKVQCEMCSKALRSKYTKLRPMVVIHAAAEPTRHSLRSRINCPVENCLNSSVSYAGLLMHIRKHHNIEVEKQDILFTSLKEFQKWKNTYEKNSSSHYVAQRASVTLNGLKKQYYNCHHTSLYHIKRTCKDQSKINMTCTSRMEITLGKNIVKLQFWITHIGHNIEVTRSKEKINCKKSNSAVMIKCNRSRTISDSSNSEQLIHNTEYDQLIDIKEEQDESDCDQSKKIDNNIRDLLINKSYKGGINNNIKEMVSERTLYNIDQLGEIKNICKCNNLTSQFDQTGKTNNACVPQQIIEVSGLIETKALSISKLGKINSNLSDEEKLQYLKELDKLVLKLVEK